MKLENHGLSVGKELLTGPLLNLEQCLCLGWKDKLKSLLFGDHVFLPEVELSIRWGLWGEREVEKNQLSNRKEDEFDFQKC